MTETQPIRIIVGPYKFDLGTTWFGADIKGTSTNQRNALSKTGAIGKLADGYPDILRGHRISVRMNTASEIPGYYASVPGIAGEAFGHTKDEAMGQLIIANQGFFDLVITDDHFLVPEEPDY